MKHTDGVKPKDSGGKPHYLGAWLENNMIIMRLEKIQREGSIKIGCSGVFRHGRNIRIL